MRPTRVTAASRPPERHGSAAAARPIGAASETSFAAVLGNAAIAPPISADHEKPTEPRGGGAAAAFSPATVRDDPGPVPVPLAATQMPEVAPTGAVADAPPLGASATRSQPASRETLGNDPDTAAGGASELRAPGTAHRSRQPDGDPSSAPRRGTRNPMTASGDPIAGAVSSDRDAGKEGQGRSSSLQTDSSTASAASATSPHALHSSRRRENREGIAFDAALLMPGDVPLGAAPAGGAASRAVADAKAEGPAEGPAREQDRPVPATDAGVRSGPAHNIAAPSPASLAPVRPQASLPDAADSGASAGVTVVPAITRNARSTGVSGPSRVDPKLIDRAFIAAPKIAAGNAVAADFRLAPHEGEGPARDDGALTATVAGAAMSPAPAAPVPEHSSNVSAANPTSVDIPDQLFGHLLQSIQNPGQDVVLRLRPPELGDVTVRVAVIGREVSAWFASPHPQIQQAISQAIGQLHTSLGNAGYNLSGAWVGADASDPRDRHSPRPPQPDDARARSEPVMPPDANPGAQAGAGVSVYV